MLLSSWCESQWLTRQPPSSHRLRFSANRCSVLWAGELLTWLLALAPLQHILTSWGHLWHPASPEGSAIKDRQGCQASNSRKSNNNITRTYTLQLWSAVCWAVLWFLRNSGLVSCSYPSRPQFPWTWCCGDGLQVFLVVVLLPHRLTGFKPLRSFLCFNLPREGLESPLAFLEKGSKETQRVRLHMWTQQGGEKGRHGNIPLLHLVSW